jgi:uncharacterized protein YdcH (DUF465 family)
MIEKHDLHHEFPEFEQEIRYLKMKDAHFSRLFKDYHELDQEIHRIEVGVESTADEYLEKQKLARLHLKDELFTMLKKVKIPA